MECLRFTSFKKIAYISLLRDVSNSGDLLGRIQQAAKLEGSDGDHERALVNYAFIDASLITSLLHLQVALLQSLVAEAQGKLRTKTIHSEIIWTLNPTNNITEALRRFGISKDTKTLILIQVLNETEKVDASRAESSMKDLVKGSLVPLAQISECTDWARVRKVYKVNEDAVIKGAADERTLRFHVDAIVTSMVATKTVQV